MLAKSTNETRVAPTRSLRRTANDRCKRKVTRCPHGSMLSWVKKKTVLVFGFDWQVSTSVALDSSCHLLACTYLVLWCVYYYYFFLFINNWSTLQQRLELTQTCHHLLWGEISDNERTFLFTLDLVGLQCDAVDIPLRRNPFRNLLLAQGRMGQTWGFKGQLFTME